MSAVQRKRSVLVVDDEDAVREAICQTLVREGYQVVDASNANDALYEASRARFDAAIVDIRMPGMPGDSLVPLLKKSCPDTIVIVLTAVSDDDPRFQALVHSNEAFACLKKPCTIKDLRATLKMALEGLGDDADAALDRGTTSLLNRAGRFIHPTRSQAH